MTLPRNVERSSGGRRSAGLLPFRLGAGLEVFLGHLGGPLWARKDAGAWTVIKGEYGPEESAEAAARREWAEETGLPVPRGRWIDLGEVRQSGGKRVVAWAVGADEPSGAPVREDLDGAVSGTFTMQWPPRSGTMRDFPELDRFGWFTAHAARERIVAGQVPLLDRLVGSSPARRPGPP